MGFFLPGHRNEFHPDLFIRNIDRLGTCDRWNVQMVRPINRRPLQCRCPSHLLHQPKMGFLVFHVPKENFPARIGISLTK